jgi:hypothetical protein
MEILKSYGKLVVFEIDDLLTELPPFLSHHQSSPETQQSLADSIALADVVTTTTPRLGTQLQKLSPNIVCVPNCIKDLPPERVAHDERASPKATLIVASSDAVLVDCLIDPLRQIQQQHGESIKLIVVGPIALALEKGGLIFERMPVLGYTEFTKLLQTLINPIGLIPLDDSVFSACKSPIKYFDYSAAQIPSICSNVPPYADYVQNDVTGVLVDNTTTNWVCAINSLIQSTEARLKLANAARQYVIDTHLADQAGDAWQTVINRLKVERVEIPGLVEASKLRIRPNINARWIARKLTQRHTYRQLKAVLRNEGIDGIKKRLRRW